MLNKNLNRGMDDFLRQNELQHWFLHLETGAFYQLNYALVHGQQQDSDPLIDCVTGRGDQPAQVAHQKWMESPKPIDVVYQLTVTRSRRCGGLPYSHGDPPLLPWA